MKTSETFNDLRTMMRDIIAEELAAAFGHSPEKVEEEQAKVEEPEKPDYRHPMRYARDGYVGLDVDGHTVLVDTADADAVMQMKLSVAYNANAKRSYCWVNAGDSQKVSLLGRLLMEVTEGQVRYRNRNPLDCRRENLEIVEPKQESVRIAGVNGRFTVFVKEGDLKVQRTYDTRAEAASAALLAKAIVRVLLRWVDDNAKRKGESA